MSDSQQPYLETLKEKYQLAIKDIQEANKKLEIALQRKAAYGETLKVEGIDIATLAPSNGDWVRPVERNSSLFNDQDSKNDADGDPVEPHSDTHALYLLIRKHGNRGFTFPELKKLADVEGYNLSERAIRNTFWKQKNSKRMERIGSGKKIRLTKEGEAFNKFRPTKLGKPE